MRKVFNKIFVNFILIITILTGIVFVNFNACEIKNADEDGAVLSRLFAVTDFTVSSFSDALELKETTTNQNNQTKDVFKFDTKLILNNNSNFYMQINSSAFLFFVAIFFIFVMFNLKFNFMLRLWRFIFVEFLSKILFSLLPRSVSIRTLLLNISPCALF